MAQSGADPLPALAEAFAEKNILFGFAVNDRRLPTDGVYRGLIQKHASIIVAENAMKWEALRPAIDQFEFNRANVIVDFAQANKMKLRGHTLCWHRGLPWWFEKTATPQNAHALLTEHIQTVVRHYAGRVHSWDVVNEAIRPEDNLPNGLRNSIWYRLLGDSYIETAFKEARKADPRALLTYNDYGLEYDNGTDNRHRDAVLDLLRRLKQRNVPIDAVGIQSHLRANHGERYGSGVASFIRQVKKLGLQVFITELDVDDSSQPKELKTRDSAVANVYEGYLRATLATADVSAVLCWGVQDPAQAQSEMKEREDGGLTRPFLFDLAGQPTPAYYSSLDAVKRVPAKQS
ncbi:MAG: endo-1,4-beta-xylanase [Acidobacteriaceae bacterium]|nr:endo-1,4-beta-xylanase [Acidobacteriaceae bacterium]